MVRLGLVVVFSHRYVPPPVAVSMVDTLLQLSERPLLAAIATVGAVVLMVVDRLAAAVQPFVAWVTVTVLVPAADTPMPAVVAPLFQRYVPPPVAVRLMLGVVQVTFVVPLLFVMPDTGNALTVTVREDVAALHPAGALLVKVSVTAPLKFAAAV